MSCSDGINAMNASTSSGSASTISTTDRRPPDRQTSAAANGSSGRKRQRWPPRRKVRSPATSRRAARNAPPSTVASCSDSVPCPLVVTIRCPPGRTARSPGRSSGTATASDRGTGLEDIELQRERDRVGAHQVEVNGVGDHAPAEAPPVAVVAIRRLDDDGPFVHEVGVGRLVAVVRPGSGERTATHRQPERSVGELQQRERHTGGRVGHEPAQRVAGLPRLDLLGRATEGEPDTSLGGVAEFRRNRWHRRSTPPWRCSSGRSRWRHRRTHGRCRE